jgi:acetolactate synthase I/II/III large subunit
VRGGRHDRERTVNNAELIVATLRKAGVARGFGIPSGNVLPLIEAMRTGGVAFVLTAHEGAAGFAAEVTGRVTGRPGLAIATVGPGATNLATGVGGAFLDRSAMIAITCNLPVAQLGRRIQMGIDHHALYRPIVKATLPLREGNVAGTLAAALRIALSEPPGPVHLDLPEDVATAPCRETVPDIPEGQRLPPPDAGSLAAVRAALAVARRPVAVIGADARRLRDVGLLRRVVERHRMPFAHTTMAKGLIDDAHPLAIGCIERACRRHQREFLGGADLIVGLGYDTVEVEYEAWIGAVPLAHVGIEAADTDGSVSIRAQAAGDLDAALAALAGAPATANAWTADALAAHRARFGAALRPKVEGFAPHAAIDAVRAALPADGVLAFDVGAHTHQIASQWAAPAPHRFLITNGWSSMGFGLPAAIAAKLARPDRPVVCLIGDGCFQLTCGELATARRLGITLPVVVLDDRILGLIQVKQARRQMPAYGTDLDAGAAATPPAHYFGVPAVGVADAAELRAALHAALAAAGPTVIEAVVDPSHYWETVFD